MTSRQRILAAIHLETPDRVPVTPFGLGKLNPDGAAAADLIDSELPGLPSLSFFVSEFIPGEPRGASGSGFLTH